MLKSYIVTYLQEEWYVLKLYIVTYLQEEWYVEVICFYLLAGGLVC